MKKALLFIMTCAAAVLSCSRTGKDLNKDLADRLFPLKVNDVNEVPFTFEYGGVPSGEFISGWNYSASDKVSDDRIVRTAVYTDPATGLEIKALVSIYKLSGGIDYTLYLKNTGSENTPVISNLKALDLSVPAVEDVPGCAPVLHRLRGTDGYMYFCKDDFMPIVDTLETGRPVEFGTYDAYSSSGAFPFYDVTYPGGGFVTAVGWTGKWNSMVELNGGAIHTTAQMSELHTFLYPGEEIRSPRILLVFWQGSERADGINKFRKTMLDYICPRYDGELQRVPIAHMSSSNHQDNSTTAENDKSYLKTIKDYNLDFELAWLDAWWHKGGFPSGLGNYVYPLETAVDPVRFPGGVKEISDYAKSLGLKFLCWFAPEALSKKSLLAAEHPEWVMRQSGASGYFNLGIPEALEYMTGYMDACIKEWNIDVWRTDFGFRMDAVREMEKDTPDRVGMTEIRHVEGIYKLWDDLRAQNPGLMIDNCCGGGSRIDLETSSRSISLWRTDNGVWATYAHNLKDLAVLNQCNNVCLNQYVIQSSCAMQGNSPYYMRSGFNNGLIFNDDNRDPSYNNDIARDGISEAKRLRKYCYGDFYPLIFHSNSCEEWCAYQYNRPEEGDGAVFIFRRDESPDETMTICLKGLDPDAKYSADIYGESFRKKETVTVSGRELMAFPVTIDSRPASALIEYRRIGR